MASDLGAGKSKKSRNKPPSLMATSRLKQECPVTGCKIKTRSDHMKSHFKNKVLWDNFGNPVSEDDEEYKVAAINIKNHTDFARRRKINFSKIPDFKVVANKNPTQLDKYLSFTSNLSLNPQSPLFP